MWKVYNIKENVVYQHLNLSLKFKINFAIPECFIVGLNQYTIQGRLLSVETRYVS